MGNQLSIRKLQQIADQNGCKPAEMLEKMKNDQMLRNMYNVTLADVETLQAGLNSGAAYGVGDVISFESGGVRYKVPWDFDIELPIHDEASKAKYEKLYTESNVVKGQPKDGGEPVTVVDFSKEVEQMKINSMMAQLEAKKIDIEKEIEANKGIISSAENLAIIGAVGTAAAGAAYAATVVTAEEVYATFTSIATKLKYPKEAIAQGLKVLANGLADALTPAGVITKQVAIRLMPLALVACKDDITTQEQKVIAPQAKPTDYTPMFNALIALVQTLINQGIGNSSTLNSILKFLQDWKSDNDQDMKRLMGQLAIIVGQIGDNTTMLSLLIDAVGDSNELLNVIIDKLTEGNKTLQNIKDALDVKFEKDDKYQQKMAKILAAVYSMMGLLHCDLSKLIGLMIKNNMTLDQILAKLDNIAKKLDSIEQKLDKLSVDVANFKTAVLNAIANIDFTADVDLSGIEALLNRLINSQDTTNDKLDKLAQLFNKFSGTTTAQLDHIISLIGNDSAKLDAIIDLLTKMDANNQKRTEQIIAAIEALGVDVIAKMDAILNAINNGNEKVGTFLDTIIANQQIIIKNNKDGFKAVIDIIADFAGQTNANFNTLIKQNDTIISLLKDIFGKIEGFDAWFQAIYNKIPAGGQGGCNLDFEALMAKLDEILKAIKDHKVEVKVDVTGEITCNCGCGGSVHEGIIGNLNDLLG